MNIITISTNNTTSLSGHVYSIDYINHLINKLTSKQKTEMLLEICELNTSFIGALSKVLYNDYRIM